MIDDQDEKSLDRSAEQQRVRLEIFDRFRAEVNKQVRTMAANLGLDAADAKALEHRIDAACVNRRMEIRLERGDTFDYHDPDLGDARVFMIQRPKRAMHVVWLN